VAEFYLKKHSKEEVTTGNGADVKGEALTKGSGTTKSETLHSGYKRAIASFLVASKPCYLRIKWCKIIVLTITGSQID
jgi:hypothetical protein